MTCESHKKKHTQQTSLMNPVPKESCLRFFIALLTFMLAALQEKCDRKSLFYVRPLPLARHRSDLNRWTRFLNDSTSAINIELLITFQDCHGRNSNFNEILKDDTQNYIIEREGNQNLTHTVIVFRRALETCDPRDVPFTADTTKMFWGYGERDIVSTQLDKIKFKAKGLKSIHLLNPSFKMPSNKSEVKHWDATVQNVSLSEFWVNLWLLTIFFRFKSQTTLTPFTGAKFFKRQSSKRNITS